MSSTGPLSVDVGPGLSFTFELPEALLGRIARFLEGFDVGAEPPAAPALRVTSEPPAAATPAGGVLLEEPPLVVRRAGAITLFELPGIRAWCDTDSGRGGVALERPSEAQLDLFVGLALAPLLIELAACRGWLGVHAAGVAIDGLGILLPGPSGAGKSTIFAHAHRAGYGVLSDDLIWLLPTADGATMVAFPRGGYAEVETAPTANAVALRAIVCPVIAGDAESRLLPLDFPRALEVLIGEGGFLGSGAPAGTRFSALVRIARSVPAYRLEAGPSRREAPALLACLAARLSRQKTS